MLYLTADRFPIQLAGGKITWEFMLINKVLHIEHQSEGYSLSPPYTFTYIKDTNIFTNRPQWDL